MVRYPVFIVCRDRVTPLLDLIAWLERVGQTDIILVDNDSAYPPLLDYLDTTDYRVVRFTENHGHRVVWTQQVREKLGITGRFILTDPDVVPITECPDDAVEVMAAALDRYPDHIKAGFGLRIDDIPDHYPRKHRVIEWERQHWSPELEPGLYDTTIDSTFALHREDRGWGYGPAIRTAYPYLLEHVPWYSDPARLSDEESFYFARASRETATWSLADHLPVETPAPPPAAPQPDAGSATEPESALGQAALSDQSANPAPLDPSTPDPDDGAGYRKDVLLIVPTRGRPEHAVAFAEAFFAFSGRTNLLFARDDDDFVPYPEIVGAEVVVYPRLRLTGTLNVLAATYRDEYDYLAVMDDDHRIETLNWDTHMVAAIRQTPAGIAMLARPPASVAGWDRDGDAVSHAEPSVVLMDAAVPRTLGYLVPPDLVQGFRGQAWRALGEALGTLRPVDSVMITDAASICRERSPAESDVFARDAAAFARYLATRLPLDAAHVRAAVAHLTPDPPSPLADREMRNKSPEFPEPVAIAATEDTADMDEPPTSPSQPVPTPATERTPLRFARSRAPRPPKEPQNDVLVIVPTRGRPENSQAFAEAFFANSSRSDLLFGLDDDDHESYPRIPGAHYDVNPRLRFVGTVNLLSNRFGTRYSYIAVLGDDMQIRTPGWDAMLIESIAPLPFGIAYGNDLNQGPILPTAVLLNANIVRILGYIAPPNLVHLFSDNFWRRLGQELDSLQYRDDVILEHMHYTIGKASADELYLDVNSNEAFRRDGDAFAAYERDRLHRDLALLMPGRFGENDLVATGVENLVAQR